MSDTKNFLTSLAALRDSTKYVLEFLNNQEFTYADIDSGNSSEKNEDMNCSQAFDVLKTLKRDVRTFTNANFLTSEDGDSSSEEFKDCETADLDNLHSQLSMIVDSFNSDVDVLNSTENSNSSSKTPKLDIVLSHQETLKSIDKQNTISQMEQNLPDKESNIEEMKSVKNKEDTNESDKKIENTSDSGKSYNSSGPSNKNNTLQVVKENEEVSNLNLNQNIDEKDKSSRAKDFLFRNTMPQTPEIEKIKNYVTDIDLNKLNNIEIIKLILDSLIQTCNEILQLKSDTLSDVLGTYPKSPLAENVITYPIPSIKDLNKDAEDKNNSISNNDNDNNTSSSSSSNEKSPSSPTNEEKLKTINENETINDTNENKESTNETTNIDEMKVDESSKSDKANPKITIDTNVNVLNTIIKNDEIESLGNPNKQRNPKELLKELECLIILIHSLYDNTPNNTNKSIKNDDSNLEEKSFELKNEDKRSESMNSILTSNTELNSVINAIDSLLKSSPRFNNQCVQINAESKKKFQLIGVLSVVDRMTRTRLNDQRATPNQLDRVNRLIDLLNKSLVRQYVEQRFAISPDKEKKMELGRITYLVEKSKNSRLSNQDWCSQKLIREKEIEDIFDQTKYSSLENQRFIMRPTKERDMYINSLLKRVDKLDSYRLSNQDAVIKRTKPINDSLYSINSTESDAEISSKRKEGPIKRLRRFSKSIKS